MNKLIQLSIEDVCLTLFMKTVKINLVKHHFNNTIFLTKVEFCFPSKDFAWRTSK